MDNLLVPSSIQRIRSFLVEMCGMKVKPWASTEETLAALHATLSARHRCGIFWDSLRTLLESLARDLKTRCSALPGALIDNEVLDSERYVRLLDEIRQGLAQQQSAGTTTSSFRHLSAALSAPALGLLLFLGGVASIGCEHSGLKQPAGGPDATPAADASSAELGTGTTTPDARSATPLDALPLSSPDTRPDAPTDGPPRIILPPNPDTPPSPDAATRGADGGPVTIQDIMDSCNVPASTQDSVLACLKGLRDSWTTGITQTLAGTPCDSVNRQLQCFTYSRACSGLGTPEFTVGQTNICDPILVYVGVRFV